MLDHRETTNIGSRSRTHLFNPAHEEAQSWTSLYFFFKFHFAYSGDRERSHLLAHSPVANSDWSWAG